MTPHEYMKSHVRSTEDGGLAWDRSIFSDSPSFAPTVLLDAAVDIAWECLMPDTSNRPLLEVEKEENLIVFRVQTLSPFAARSLYSDLLKLPSVST